MIVFQAPVGETQIDFIDGVIVTLDSNWRPIAGRVLLLATTLADNDEFGSLAQSSLSAMENKYLDLISRRGEKDFLTEKIVPA